MKILPIILGILLIPAIILESTFVSFPLVLILSVILYVIYPKLRIIILIFLAGCALDATRTQFLGLTPLVIFIILFILNLNTKLFDIRDYVFLLLVVVLGSLVYSNIVGYQINGLLLGMSAGALLLGGSIMFRKREKIVH